MKIKIKLLNENAKIPTQKCGDACFDFYCCEDINVIGKSKVKIHTGIAMEIPEGYHLKLFMRSSTGSKTFLRLSNCVGIIDSSYRGEIIGFVDNIGDTKYCIKNGYRLFQGLIEKNIPVIFEQVDELSETERGTCGFGSTGK